MGKKYELLENNTIEIKGRTLYRIKALRSFGIVWEGDIGGYIEKEENLSHEGNCWVANEAKVFENARITGNAEVSDRATVRGNAIATNDSSIYGNAVVGGSVELYDYSLIGGIASVTGWIELRDGAKIYGSASVVGDTYLKMKGNATISGNSIVMADCSIVEDDAIITGHSYLSCYNSIIGEDTIIDAPSGKMIRLNCVELRDDAYITSNESLFSIANFKEDKTLTVYKKQGGLIGMTLAGEAYIAPSIKTIRSELALDNPDIPEERINKAIDLIGVWFND